MQLMYAFSSAEIISVLRVYSVSISFSHARLWRSKWKNPPLEPYVMDGLAYAGEALSGRYIGARNREAFTDTVRHLFGWGAVIAVLFTLVYALGGNAFLGLLTDDKEVIAVADTYFYWALAVPAVGIAAFIWDGIFIGATATRGMLLSMAAAAVSFFILYYGLHPVLANHALWLAFLTYLLMRGVVQTGLSREVIRRAFPSKKEPAWREG